MRSLVALRALEPRLRLGWSVPRVKKDYTASRDHALPAYGLLRQRAPPPAVRGGRRTSARVAATR